MALSATKTTFGSFKETFISILYMVLNFLRRILENFGQLVNIYYM